MLIHSLVIGGTRGLGKVVVDLLIKEGHYVSVLSRKNPHKIKKNADYFTANLNNPNDYLDKIVDVTKKNGMINYLIFLQRYRDTKNEWDGELEVSLHATRSIIDILKNKFFVKKSAGIVIVSSLAAKFATSSQPLSYAVVKAGLNQMIRHYAAELGDKGIRVNGVSPSSFIKDETKRFYSDSNYLVRLYKEIIPLKRMCKADDVANVILFLCSNNSSFISGQNIIVDGGLSVINHESLAQRVKNIKT